MHCFLKQKRYIGLVMLLVLALLSGCTRTAEAAAPSVQEESTAPAEPERQPKEGIQTLLVICLDSFEVPRDSGAYRNGSKADLIMVMVIDEGRGKTTALQLNPDTMVSFTVPGTSDPVDMPLDLLFSLAAVWIWLYHSFAVCRGDIRTVYLFGMMSGGFLWEKTAGRCLIPVFFGFWKILGRLFRIFLFPLKKILEFAKILFASGEKWVTIVCTKILNSQRKRRKESHGKKKHPAQKCESGSSSRIKYP